MKPITWTRITTEQTDRNARLQHGDHVGTDEQGRTVALLTRALDGRWHVWTRRAGDWMDVCDYHALTNAKKAADGVLAFCLSR